MTGAKRQLLIERVNPLDHAEGIKALYAAEGEAGAFFAPFFDVAYADAVADGAHSWIGREESGEIVMHMACFPHRFRLGDRTLTGGLGVNLIVTPRHRSLLAALKLLRALVADTRALGFDFLYADPNLPGQTALKAAGFEIFGNLTRYAEPIAGRNLVESLAVRSYRAWRSLGTRAARVPLQCTPASEFDASTWFDPVAADDRLVPVHSAALYARRLRGYPTRNDFWLTDGEPGSAASVALLIRLDGDVAAMWAIRQRQRATEPRVVSVIASAPRALRALGAARLQVWALGESSLDAQLRGAGLERRADTTPVQILPLTDAGTEVARRPVLWQITALDCDRGG
jgi:hypothetical protein